VSPSGGRLDGKNVHNSLLLWKNQRKGAYGATREKKGEITHFSAGSVYGEKKAEEGIRKKPKRFAICKTRRKIN